MPELLSPVGNMECLYVAINAGCDAVYLAGKNFGARSFAGNFTREELIKAINICHLYGVKIYVTVNTLIYDVEVDRFLDYIDFLHKNGVDALIMQDIGMIDLVRKTYPNLEIHASTQLNIHNKEGVKLLEELGVKRVVLSREVSIDLIKEIKKDTNIELEVFIHGALCMSYSGECLMSYFIGGRSGNRGTCAQCCRQPYSLKIDEKIVEDNKYLLSTKDLNTLDYIKELIDSNVESLKIEGRMKRPEYVYLVTSIYRKAIDNYKKYGKTNITDIDIINLKKVFNREFTKGFIFNEDNDSYTNTFRPNHIGINIGEVIDYKNNKATIKLSSPLNINDGIRIIGSNDTGTIVTIMYKNGISVKSGNIGDIIRVPIKDKINKNDKVVKTTDYYLMKEIENNIKKERKVYIKGTCILKLNSPIKLSITDNINTIEVISDVNVEKSKSIETTKDMIEEKLKRLGDTIYEFESLDIISDSNIFIPISIINKLRREAIDKLTKKRLEIKEYKKSNYYIELKNYKKVKCKSILIHTLEEYEKIKDTCDIIYIDSMEEKDKINDKKCILKLNRINEHLPNYHSKLLVSDLGSIKKYKNVDTDFSLNVTNSYSVAYLHSIGVNKITLSYELSYKQVKTLIDSYINRYKKLPNVEVIIEGYPEVMVCKYNLLKKYNKNYGELIDRFKNKYNIKIKDNFMYIYNYKKINLKENYFDIGVNYIRVNCD